MSQQSRPCKHLHICTKLLETCLCNSITKGIFILLYQNISNCESLWVFFKQNKYVTHTLSIQDSNKQMLGLTNYSFCDIGLSLVFIKERKTFNLGLRPKRSMGSNKVLTSRAHVQSNIILRNMGRGRGVG